MSLHCGVLASYNMSNLVNLLYFEHFRKLFCYNSMIENFIIGSERSERDTYRGKNEKIGDVCWRASEGSETVLGVDNAKSGICYMYVCMDGTYAL